MPSVFRFIAQMSITASYVIAAVLILRLIMRRFPRKYSYYLWYAVLFRLCCPFSIGSVFSIFNLNVTKGESTLIDLSAVPVSTIHMSEPVSAVQTADPGVIDLGVTRITETVNQVLTPADTVFPATPAAPAVPDVPAAAAVTDPMLILSIVWLTGMVILVSYALISYLRLRRSLKFSAPLSGNIKQVDISSPFILGLIHPVIYVPFGLSGDAFDLAIAHEQYHLKRKDNWIRALSYVLLGIHWMNPFCWIAYHFIIKDMEISCDEHVLSIDKDIRESYSSALLAAAAEKGNHIYHTVSFGGVSVKERVKNAMRFKRGRKAASVIACLLCVAMLAACAFNGKSPVASESPGPENKPGTSNTANPDAADTVANTTDNTVLPVDTTEYVRIPTSGAEYVPGKMQQAGQGAGKILTHDKIYYWYGCEHEGRVAGYNVLCQDLSDKGQPKYLCNKSGCSHNDVTCSAFFKDEGRLMYYAREDCLLVLDFESGSLLRLKEDWSSWEEIMNIGKSFVNCYYDENSFQTLDSKLYLPVIEQGFPDTVVWEILELDIEEKTYKVLHTFEPNQRICGGFDGCLILEQKIASGSNKDLSFVPSLNCRYDLLDVRTGGIKNALSAELPYISCVNGHNVMYMIMENDQFVTHTYDLLTGTERSAVISNPPEHLLDMLNQRNDWTSVPIVIDDTHFALSYAEFKGSEPVKDHCCIIDAEKGIAIDSGEFDATTRKYAQTGTTLYYTKHFDSSTVYAVLTTSSYGQ